MEGRDDSKITAVLEAIESGNRSAAADLLPLMYDRLRGLADAQLAHEPGRGAGYTLQPTALVHEAYLRLIPPPGSARASTWNSRAHFFAAASQAMRRILVERARRRDSLKRGGASQRVPLEEETLVEEPDPIDMLALDEALTRLEAKDERWGRIVGLRFFTGLSLEETAMAMGLGLTTVKEEWAYARAWLQSEMSKGRADERR